MRSPVHNPHKEPVRTGGAIGERPLRPSCWCHAGLWQGHCLSCGAPARVVSGGHFARWWHVYLTLVVASVVGYLLVGEFYDR